MSKKPLSRFETLAQRLVEGSFSRLFGGRLQPLDIANRLAHVIEDSEAEGHIADCYHVHLNPDDYIAIWEQNPNLPEYLADYLSQLAHQGGLILPVNPRIEVTADPSLGKQQVVVYPNPDPEGDEPTQVRNREKDDHAMLALQTVDAFLIVEGRRHVPLDQPFITIGRRADNDIVVDAPTISRQHAQLRWRYGRFVVYDLGSRGGTAVNGQPVTECVLQPGDLITLSDVTFIYGEGLAETEAGRPRSLSNHNQPTVTLTRPPKQRQSTQAAGPPNGVKPAGDDRAKR